MKSPWLKAALLPVLVAAGCVLMVSVFNYSGVCVRQLRVVPDDQKVRAVAAVLLGKKSINRFELTKEGVVKIEWPKMVPHADVDEFLRLNPSCCVVDPRGGSDNLERTFASRLTGRIAAMVTANYARRSMDEAGNIESRTATLQAVVGNCGVVTGLRASLLDLPDIPGLSTGGPSDAIPRPQTPNPNPE